MLTDDELKSAINSELDDIAHEAIMRGETGKSNWEPEIDSHSVLRVCLRIEEEIGVEISEDCIPVGGFSDRNTCVEVMMKHSKEAIAQAEKAKVEAKVETEQ